MTQMMTEQLTHEEFTTYLAYGDPISTLDLSSEELDWISTLESTTFEGLTFGYHELPCMSTVV